jgi:hypothetical protein
MPAGCRILTGPEGPRVYEALAVSQLLCCGRRFAAPAKSLIILLSRGTLSGESARKMCRMCVYYL